MVPLMAATALASAVSVSSPDLPPLGVGSLSMTTGKTSFLVDDMAIFLEANPAAAASQGSVEEPATVSERKLNLLPNLRMGPTDESRAKIAQKENEEEEDEEKDEQEEEEAGEGWDRAWDVPKLG
jgi:hypothetical protein